MGCRQVRGSLRADVLGRSSVDLHPFGARDVYGPRREAGSDSDVVLDRSRSPLRGHRGPASFVEVAMSVEVRIVLFAIPATFFFVGGGVVVPQWQ